MRSTEEAPTQLVIRDRLWLTGGSLLASGELRPERLLRELRARHCLLHLPHASSLPLAIVSGPQEARHPNCEPGIHINKLVEPNW